MGEGLPPWLERGLADLFPAGAPGDPDQSLAERLKQAANDARPLRIKLGIDPTGTDIHLGHSILFRKLRAFQDAGHTAVLIIGDFTARIGDPSGKSATRVQLSAAEVEANADTYLVQLGLGQPPERALLDFTTPGRLEVRRNSEWLAGLDLPQVIELLGTSTVGQMLAKEEFANRYGSGTPISLHEFLYPLLQGYDSVAVASDLELGGTDQKFNVAMGRDLQRHFGQRPQFGLLLPILPGLDGVQKMSKSLGNSVGLNEGPLAMYSKLEKVPDAVADQYLTLLTDLDPAHWPTSPRERQKALALAITASCHGLDAASTAQADAAHLVAGEMAARTVPEASLAALSFPAKAFHLLSALGLCVSSSEARRQIQGGGVRLDGEKLTDVNRSFSTASELEGRVLQLGKKTFLRLVA
ncbi:tyrosine--tRNA ligase [Synechococcus sp. Cruz-9H2]|uniref:tyrosine--tRNA ligase n=1 Tax=unclassified Synechococcus TaxID=2626047 RepID=UPI0020CF8D23|nr:MULTISPECIES: tyrosine--tRNA ligase [unclassified Synechococcus]MCP9819176.1 tyrosine--tRNA ligase [Synechococcus sp. Cruz-9H2]MCP9843680.1 tyrosine--tRNA ligase [Synechococcus sp. Edmonson 11F2]MCP9855601.1 tyrosine--tRNA ligase [Synechococcus sp. Cruz-9C9]MCP9863039.1 tyrosine--tRNA ligase [Synechococcus sp. Cruz-7E5]MCP9870086.1 tyrosine--tRNA ligase [Synechococcus sp. Cruz-7B9]